jgi:hypothetical protein
MPGYGGCLVTQNGLKTSKQKTLSEIVTNPKHFLKRNIKRWVAEGENQLPDVSTGLGGGWRETGVRNLRCIRCRKDSIGVVEE